MNVKVEECTRRGRGIQYEVLEDYSRNDYKGSNRYVTNKTRGEKYLEAVE